MIFFYVLVIYLRAKRNDPALYACAKKAPKKIGYILYRTLLLCTYIKKIVQRGTNTSSFSFLLLSFISSIMALSYLIGGKSLQGVEYVDPTVNQSAFSFSSSVSSSLSDYSINNNQIFPQNNQNDAENTLLLRRHGLSSHGLSKRLLQVNRKDACVELDVSRNQITTLPSQLQLFTGLTQLVLTNNSILNIPTEIYQNMGRLQILMLSENQIEAIPEDMPQYLPNLVTLSLDGNQIKSLPDSIGYWTNMRELRLGSEFGGNLITHLPSTIADMRNMVDLDVSFNMIDGVFPDNFLNLPKLRSVNLSHNQIVSLPDDVLFGACASLKTIDLSDNLIIAIHPGTVQDILQIDSLELLNLSNNQLCIIPSELLDQTNTQVVIKGNPITHFSLQAHQDESSRAYTGIVRGLVQRAELTVDHSTSNLAYDVFNMNDIDTPAANEANTIDELLGEQTRLPPILQENDATRTGLTGVAYESTPLPAVQPPDPPEIQNDPHTTFLIHSLREITLRSFIASSSDETDTLSLLPQHIVSDLARNRIQKCNYCRKPFVREWLSSVQLKTYRAHPSVVQKVRFCGTLCWQNYRRMRDELAIEAQSNILDPTQQRRDAIQYIQQHEHAMEEGSMDWIIAAVSAASIQEEQVDNLANAVF